MRPLTFHRLALLAVLLCLVAMAAIVRFDQIPSTCPLYNLTGGIPCPFCKMTSAWSLALHGEVRLGAATNPFGLLFLLLALAGILYFLYALLRQAPPHKPAGWTKRHPYLTGLFVTAWFLNWVYVLLQLPR